MTFPRITVTAQPLGPPLPVSRHQGSSGSLNSTTLNSVRHCGFWWFPFEDWLWCAQPRRTDGLLYCSFNFWQ